MSEYFDLIIQGNIVKEDTIIHNGVVAIRDGKIVNIFDCIEHLNAKEVIQANGCYVLPGAIDAHVHCYSSVDEGFTLASKSAAAGGVTTIIEMPYDAPGLIGTEELFIKKKKQLESQSIVDMALLATIKPENGLDQIPLLAKQGACGFKVSMFNTDSNRFPRINDALLYDVFSEVAKTGLPVGVHAENDEIVRGFIKKYEILGEKDPRSHAWSRPKFAESIAVLTAMELAYWTGVHLHIYHCTFPRIFELVEYFKSMGATITAETCTHYLTLTEDDMLTLKAKAKINPPLRSKEDVEGLWKQLKNGMIDIVTSDHAPWTIVKKSHSNIFENASGAPGVEVLLPILYAEGVAKGKISIIDLVNLLSKKPAEIFGLSSQKGKLEKGMDADIVVLNPNESWILDETKQHSSAGWSPYHNKRMQGKITHTFVRGNLVYNGSDVVGNPGTGQFIYAKH